VAGRGSFLGGRRNPAKQEPRRRYLTSRALQSISGAASRPLMQPCIQKCKIYKCGDAIMSMVMNMKTMKMERLWKFEQNDGDGDDDGDAVVDVDDVDEDNNHDDDDEDNDNN